MKFRLVIVFYLLSVIPSMAQPLDDSLAWRERILQAVRKYNLVTEVYGWTISKERQQADSLFLSIPLSLATSYANDSNNIVRYYSFLRILELDDSVAFEIVRKNIGDTSYVDGWGTCMGWSEHFNKLLARTYDNFIERKYGEGLYIRSNRKIIVFTEKSRRVEKRKRKELERLLAGVNLSVKSLW